MERVVGSVRLEGPVIDRDAFDGAVAALWQLVGRPCGWFPSASAGGQRLEWNECGGDVETSMYYLEGLSLQLFEPAGVSLRGTLVLVNKEGACVRVDVRDSVFACR